MPPNTDDPSAADDDDADAPNATDNYYGSKYSQNSPYPLRKRNKYFKNALNTKNPILKNHYCPCW